jgi:predicted Zn-dependent peptidase
VLNELDEQFFYDSMQTIKTVTPEELRTLANKYLLEEDFYQLTVL